ncbi:MAG: hypothetical protein MZV70_04845 [Desulfobacterales bacterium]|nr:hypothetical protein [Desulfobacterales bacterium]
MPWHATTAGRIEPEWIVWLPGLVTGLNVACRAVGEPGDAVLTAIADLSAFPVARRALSGAASSRVPHADDGQPLDVRLRPPVEQAITPPHAAVACSATRTTRSGRVFSRAGARAPGAQIAERHDLVICSDEIHCGLVLDPGLAHIALAALDARRPPGAASPSWRRARPSTCPGWAARSPSSRTGALRRRFMKAMARHRAPRERPAATPPPRRPTATASDWRQALHRLPAGQPRPGGRRCVERDAGPEHGATSRPPTSPGSTAGALGIRRSCRLLRGCRGRACPDGTDFGAPGFVRLNFGCPRSVLRPRRSSAWERPAAGCPEQGIASAHASFTLRETPCSFPCASSFWSSRPSRRDDQNDEVRFPSMAWSPIRRLERTSAATRNGSEAVQS